MPDTGSPFRLRQPITHRLLAILLFLTAGSAFAYNGFTVGVAANPVDGVPLSVHATLPLFSVSMVQHSLRSDIAFAFKGSPGVSISYLFGASPEGGVERYLGMGGGVAFVPRQFGSLLLSVHGLAGMRIPLIPRVQATAEVHLARNRLVTGLGLTLGLEYSFGAAR